MRRQADLPVASPVIAYKRTGGDRMTDYEMIMIFLTILALLMAAARKNDR